MPSLCFEPLHAAAREACVALAAAAAPVAPMSGQVTTIPVVARVDNEVVAELRRRLEAPSARVHVAGDSSQAASIPLERDVSRTIVVSIDRSVAALRRLLALGIGDVVEYSDDSVVCIAARLKRWARVDAAIAAPLVATNLVGRSEPWLATLRCVVESALFSAAPVLLSGPTGTGKELLARLLHTLDARPRKRDLITVDCTTLARDLAGSELFGHERGAFTGAVSERDGAVALAHNGTLFLDEVGELSPDHQSQLLRAVQEKAYRRVGGTNWQRSDFRLVCATNRDLQAEVQEGRFRADLYHRIAAINCRSPALDQRRDDIPFLIEHFLASECADEPPPCVSPALIEYLQCRQYKGNVRELRQLIQACRRRHAGTGRLTLSSLPEDEIGGWVTQESRQDDVTQHDVWGPEPIDTFVRLALRSGTGLKELGRLVESAAVRIALKESRSLTEAAGRLGVTPRALHLRRAARRDSHKH